MVDSGVVLTLSFFRAPSLLLSCLLRRKASQAVLDHDEFQNMNDVSTHGPRCF